MSLEASSLCGAVGEPRDETPFASMLGNRLSSVEFVVKDYVQLRFDGPTLNAYAHPVITADGREFRWGEAGYRDALCERVLARVRRAWASPDEIVIEMDDGATITVSNRVGDVVGAESAELSTDEGRWVWRSGEWP
jgi:hypothetical protein